LQYVRLLEQPEGPAGSTGGVQSRSATRSLRGARAVKAPKQFDETVARMSTSATGPELPELAAGTPKFILQQVKDMEKLISKIEKEDSYEIFRTDLDPIEKLKGTEGAEDDEQNGGDANGSGFEWGATGRGRRPASSPGVGGEVGSGEGAPQSSDRKRAGSPVRGDGGSGGGGGGQPSRRRPRKGSSVAVNGGEPAAAATAMAGADVPTLPRPSPSTAVEGAMDVDSEGKADGEGHAKTTGPNGVLLKQSQHPVAPKTPPINLRQIRERFVMGCYIPAPGSYLVQSQEAVPMEGEASGDQAPLLTSGDDDPTPAAAAAAADAAVAGASKRPRKRPSSSRSGSSSPPLPSQSPKEEATEKAAKSPSPATAPGAAATKTASKPTGRTSSSSLQTRPTPVLPLTRDSGRLGGAAKLTFDYEPLLDWAGLRADIAGMVGRMLQWAEDWKSEREKEKNQRRQRRRRRRCRADGGGGGAGGDAKGNG
ncbi:unnamed protein product, partial [Ectocarpus fasciculatus]